MGTPENQRVNIAKMSTPISDELLKQFDSFLNRRMG